MHSVLHTQKYGRSPNVKNHSNEFGNRDLHHWNRPMYVISMFCCMCDVVTSHSGGARRAGFALISCSKLLQKHFPGMVYIARSVKSYLIGKMKSRLIQLWWIHRSILWISWFPGRFLGHVVVSKEVVHYLWARSIDRPIGKLSRL